MHQGEHILWGVLPVNGGSVMLSQGNAQCYNYQQPGIIMNLSLTPFKRKYGTNSGYT